MWHVRTICVVWQHFPLTSYTKWWQSNTQHSFPFELLQQRWLADYRKKNICYSFPHVLSNNKKQTKSHDKRNENAVTRKSKVCVHVTVWGKWKQKHERKMRNDGRRWWKLPKNHTKGGGLRLECWREEKKIRIQLWHLIRKSHTLDTMFQNFQDILWPPTGSYILRYEICFIFCHRLSFCFLCGLKLWFIYVFSINFLIMTRTVSQTFKPDDISKAARPLAEKL